MDARTFLALSDIRTIYRLLLRREPDEAGLQQYLSDIVQNGRSIKWIIGEVLKSEEFILGNRGDGPVERQLGNYRILVDPNDPGFADTIALQGTCAPHIQRIVSANVKAGDVFVDVGAKIGAVSLPAATIVGDAGKVICFEPKPENVDLLARSVALNGFGNVEIYPVGLSDRYATFGLAGAAKARTGADPGSIGVAFEGDRLLASQGRIDFVRIDVAGHEPFALRGLKATLAARTPKVLCAFDPRRLGDAGTEARVLADLVFEIGRDVMVVGRDGADHDVPSAKSLLDHWDQEDRSNTEADGTDSGRLHFDLLFTAR